MIDHYPAFSSFRALMTLWDHNVAVDRLLEQDMCFFFSKDGGLFGGTEESRLAFARMKHPDGEDGKKWVKDAAFSAVDLLRAVKGEQIQRVFSSRDLSGIKVLDRDEVEGMLRPGGKK